MKNAIKKQASAAMEYAVDQVFTEMHERFHTESGDITPEQLDKLKYFQNGLIDVIAEQVTQNIPNEKQRIERLFGRMSGVGIKPYEVLFLISAEMHAAFDVICDKGISWAKIMEIVASYTDESIPLDEYLHEEVSKLK